MRNNQEITALANQAFATDQKPLVGADITFKAAAGTMFLSAVAILAEKIGHAGFTEQMLTMLSVFLSLGAAMLTERDYEAMTAIDKALKDRRAYKDFISTHVTDHMIPRFIESFGIEDPQRGLPISGVSREVLYAHIAAGIFDYAAAFQAQRSSRPPELVPGPHTPVENILYHEQLPQINKDAADDLRLQAKQCFEAMSQIPGQREAEDNWDLAEIETAGGILGNLLGYILQGEISYVWTTIMQNNQDRSLFDDLILARRHRRNIKKGMRHFDQRYGLPGLFAWKDAIETAIIKIADDHQHKPRR